MPAAPCILVWRHLDNMLKFKAGIRMVREEDSSDFEHDMVVGAQQAGL